MKKPSLTAFTHLGFLINWIMDERPDLDITFAEIHQAAQKKQLIELLRQRFGHVADFGLLQDDSLNNIPQVEAALSDAASALEGQEAGAACIAHSGLCLAQAIVLEAIQQQFYRPQSQREAPLPQPVAPVPHGDRTADTCSPLLLLGRHSFSEAGGLIRVGGGEAAANSSHGKAEFPSQSIGTGHMDTSALPHSPARSGPTLSDWLQFAIQVNSLAETADGEDLPFQEVHWAIQGGYFPQLLCAHAQRFLDFSFLKSPAGTFDDLNNALRRASAEVRRDQFVKTGVSHSGFALALALVVIAMRSAAVSAAGSRGVLAP